MLVREEQKGDEDAIRHVIVDAFKNHPHSNHREQFLVDALRQARALAVSLVAEERGRIVGYVGFSQVNIDGRFCNWYGLAPVAVHTDSQRKAIGTALIKAGLGRIKNMNAAGCVLLGEPEYYNRFGFKPLENLKLEGVPPEFFLALGFGPSVPSGVVQYHSAFSEDITR